MNAARPRQRLVTWLTWLHLLAVTASYFGLRLIGEDWWLTGVGLYAPRLLGLLPSLILVPWLLASGPRRLLWTQLLAASVVWFPWMGFAWPKEHVPASGPALVVMSYNVHNCEHGMDGLDARIAAEAPDVVLLQELCPNAEPLVARLRARYPVVHTWDQFLLASRFALRATTRPASFEQAGRKHTERFMRYELDTSFGPLAFYSVHPLSPRFAFYALRSMGVRTSLKSGTFLRGGAAEDTLRDNFEVRRRQLAAVSKLAAREQLPMVLAGDTNLPSLSAWLSRYFGAYHDGFEAVGAGYGYTFPSRLPWLRLDRIMVSDALRFVELHTGCDVGSDHLCVVATLQRAP